MKKPLFCYFSQKEFVEKNCFCCKYRRDCGITGQMLVGWSRFVVTNEKVPANRFYCHNCNKDSYSNVAIVKETNGYERFIVAMCNTCKKKILKKQR